MSLWYLIKQQHVPLSAKRLVRPGPLLGLAVAAMVSLAFLSCSDDEDGGSPETPASDTATAEELTAVAQVMFPADQFGDYTSCDFPYREPPGTYDSCPVTDRLKARLLEINETSEIFASVICRCQNSSDTRDIVAAVEGNAGTATVALFGGSIRLDLVIVRDDDGQLLVDDMLCSGASDTSLYQAWKACEPFAP